ncbi:MAG TPA: HEAT repeat domain-containing protein [Planctomycetota bacterium]|nr:HEAT repeat domain-containing protein [Planctomycetota bacterium]
MNRRRRSASLIGFVVAVGIFWLITRKEIPRTTAPKKTALESGQRHSGSGPSSGPSTPESTGSTKPTSSLPDRVACRETLSRALAGRRWPEGLIALNLGALHRSDRRFRDMADAFCRQAGDDLVPICRELLLEGTSQHSAVLISMILGHSRRPEAFTLLQELVTRGRGSPETDDLFSSAVYSIGMIRSPQSAPFLLKLYSDSPGAQSSVVGKFGSALMAAIGMCGREGLVALKESAIRDLPQDWQPDPDEGLRAFKWSHLGLVDSPEAFSGLKAIAEGESDIRLRGMAIAAMGQSSDPAQRASLADLFLRDDNPMIRRAIVESLGDAARSSPEEWTAMRDRMAGPLTSILKSARVPSGDEMLDYGLAYLAGESRVPEATRFVDEWIRLASAGMYEGQFDWRGVAAQVLARQGASPDRFEEFLASQKNLSAVERVDLLEEFYLKSPAAGDAPAAHVEAMIRRIEAGPSPERLPYNLFAALGRIPGAMEETSRCAEAMIARAPDAASRIGAINDAVAAGGFAAPALEKAIHSADDLSVLLHATAAYLEVIPDDTAPEAAARNRMKSLFSPESLRAFNGGKLGSHEGNIRALTKAVGLYFGRFGTHEDLAWLESLPQSMAGPQGIRADYLAYFRRQLASECARAADAIRLRSK